MSNSNIINDKIVRVSDILEQIDLLNKMIKVHENDATPSMLEQYKYMKGQFLN